MCPTVGSQRVVTWPNYFETMQLFSNCPTTATFFFTVVEGKFCSFWACALIFMFRCVRLFTKSFRFWSSRWPHLAAATGLQWHLCNVVRQDNSLPVTKTSIFSGDSWCCPKGLRCSCQVRRSTGLTPKRSVGVNHLHTETCNTAQI